MAIGGILDDLNQVTQRIEEDMTLSALGFVTPVISSFFAGQEGLSALRIYDFVAGSGRFVFFDTTYSTHPRRPPTRRDSFKCCNDRRPPPKAESSSAASAIGHRLSGIARAGNGSRKRTQASWSQCALRSAVSAKARPISKTVCRRSRKASTQRGSNWPPACWPKYAMASSLLQAAL